MSEITPPKVYFNRRTFMRAGAAVASLAVTGVVYRRLNRAGSMPVETPFLLSARWPRRRRRTWPEGSASMSR